MAGKFIFCSYYGERRFSVLCGKCHRILACRESEQHEIETRQWRSKLIASKLYKKRRMLPGACTIREES